MSPWYREPGNLMAGKSFLVAVLLAPVLLVLGGQLVSAHLPVLAPVAGGPVLAQDAGSVKNATNQVASVAVGEAPFARYQEFLSVCEVSGRGTRAGATGDWFGDPPGSRMSSCLRSGDQSSYWVPGVTSAGRRLSPSHFEVRYTSGVADYRTVRPFPAGFRLRTPDLAGLRAAGAIAFWECGTGESAELPTSCPAGDRLHLRLQTPGCWDGSHRESFDQQAHLGFPVGGSCPPDHPVPVPVLDVSVYYPLPPGRLDLSLTGGSGRTAWLWYRSGWVADSLRVLVADCVNAGRRCGGR